MTNEMLLNLKKWPDQNQTMTPWLAVRLITITKFSDTRKLCCNLPKIQTKSPNLRVFSQEDANGIANSVAPDQTAPLGAV